MVEGAVTVASPPLVYDRLVQVINHPRSGSVDIANVIGEDQGLTGRLLKVVNSAFFSFPRPVDSVAQAVTVVGTSQIRDLALATSVMSMFDGVPEELVNLESFWYHSLACGVTARTIAARRGEDNVERFFVSGILHDIGHLVIYMRAGDEAHASLTLARESGRPLHECEREVLGCDHAQVGHALLEKWNFPGAFREAVAYHHNPSQASRYPVEASAVHIAEVTAHALEWGRSGERFVPPFDPAAWDTLALEADLLPLLLGETERQLEAAVHFMGAAA
jgi:HD-like signal output (HDOD) protein